MMAYSLLTSLLTAFLRRSAQPSNERADPCYISLDLASAGGARAEEQGLDPDSAGGGEQQSRQSARLVSTSVISGAISFRISSARDAIDGGLGRRSSSRGGRPRSGLSRRKRAAAAPHRNACSKLKTRRVWGSRPRSPLRGLRTRRATASASHVTRQGSGRLRSRMLAGHGVGAEEPDTVFQTQAAMVIDQMSKALVAILTEKENKFWRDSV